MTITNAQLKCFQKSFSAHVYLLIISMNF